MSTIIGYKGPEKTPVITAYASTDYVEVFEKIDGLEALYPELSFEIEW